ncbi:hypothetical protein [Vibrio profundi]|uniref:hypothetical protein n=1 Tax=Vibrio profundi TaxID=1774960 RepID=UPI0037368241
MNTLVKLGQSLIFLPAIFCFSYLLRPILMIILIPGGLCLLVILGGKEVRTPLFKMFQRTLFPFKQEKEEGRKMEADQFR